MNIKEIESIRFSSSDISSWTELVKKQLKVDNIEKQLEFSSLEGITVDALNLNAKKTHFLSSFPEDCELWLCDGKNSKHEFAMSLGAKGILDSDFDIDVRDLHNYGASGICELTYVLENVYKLLSLDKNKELKILVPLDSTSFLNIAKLRALRYMLESFYEQNEIESKLKIYATPSLREQTVYDPWVNMLRITSSIFSALNGGADAFAVFAYDYAFSILNDRESSSLGQRNAINSFHVLKEESSLKKVKDPSYGSYVIENMTAQFILKTQEKLKKNIKDGTILDMDLYKLSADETYKQRVQKLHNRSYVKAGVNDFANTTEDLKELFKADNIILQSQSDKLFPLRRLSESLELLRQEKEKALKEISLICVGAQNKLSQRLNFCKNYFEVAGIKIKQQNVKSFSELKNIELNANAICLCALDDDLIENQQIISDTFKENKLYVSGKAFSLESAINIFMGQDIYQILKDF